MSHATPAAPETISLPAQAIPAPTTGATPPLTNLAEQPAQTSEANAVQTSNEPLPVLPTSIDAQPAPAAGERQSTAAMAPPASACYASPGWLNWSTTTAESPSTEMPQIDLNANPAQAQQLPTRRIPRQTLTSRHNLQRRRRPASKMSRMCRRCRRPLLAGCYPQAQTPSFLTGQILHQRSNPSYSARWSRSHAARKRKCAARHRIQHSHQTLHVIRYRRIFEHKHRWISAVLPVRPRRDRSRPSLCPKIGFPWRRETGRRSGNTGPRLRPAICHYTSRTLSSNAMAIVLNSSSDRSAGS